MKQLKYIFLALFLPLLASSPVFSQGSGTPIGEWRIYPTNQNAFGVADAGDRVYCVTNNGFFYYDKEFGSFHQLSKVNGLNDTEIGAIQFDSITNTLLVAYRNTNIDLLRGEKVINVSDILRKSIQGEKTINHIYFKDKLAYLSCSFGLVVLDLVKLEIRDSYLLQKANGEAIKIYCTTTLGDQIFMATSNGIMQAKNSRTVNLGDLKNWKTYTAADGLPPTNSEDFRTIATYNNAVYAGVNNVRLFKLDGTQWVLTSVYTPGQKIFNLMPSRQGLLISNTYNVQVLKDPNKQPLYLDTTFIESPQGAVLDKQNVLWIADYYGGLIRYKDKIFEQLKQNGPAYSNTFKLLADRQSLIVLGGGYSPAKQFDSEAGFYEFKNGWWQNYNTREIKDPKLYPPVRDLVNGVRNPVNGKLYFTSFGYGLIEWNGLGDFKIYNSDNSPLRTELLNNPTFTRVPGIAADAEGNIWVTNFTSAAGVPGLHVLHMDGSWETFNFQNTADGTSFNNSNAFEKIIIDDNGYKWLSLARYGSGLVVFDDQSNRFRYYNRGATSGNLPGNDIFALAKDNNGEIWVGTDKGIVVFDNPDQAFFSSVSLTARTPVINRRPLLEDQPVRTIAVDGANRKWVGTDNGVWLFNPDGDESLLNFTTKNSPLPSDKIIDIAINHATGDVFIGTDAGLISYRAGSTITTEKLECANVFPNPVRPGFTGQIAISGIANNATVKITDITGTLVYETKALGGTALWNGADYNGERVRPGVYLVLSANAEGGETCISKVAVVK